MCQAPSQRSAADPHNSTVQDIIDCLPVCGLIRTLATCSTLPFRHCGRTCRYTLCALWWLASYLPALCDVVQRIALHYGIAVLVFEDCPVLALA